MLHRKSLTIPANTPEASPVSATLILTHGVSTRREVEFPSGCHGQAHVRVYDPGKQIIPWSREAWLASDGNVVVDDNVYPVDNPPFEFVMYGWNEDTVNDHTITLRVQMAGGPVAAGLARFIEMLRRIGVI